MADFVEVSETLEILGLFDLGEASDLTGSKAYANSKLALKSLRRLDDGTEVSLIERVTRLIDEEQLFVQPELVAQIAIGLVHSNVILYGPPGTGKTSLVRVLAKLFKAKIPQVWTANPEWTTFDVIGGLAPTLVNGKEVITGKLGKVTRNMLDCIESIKSYNEDEDGSFQATWCVIDEMNRCDLDKAFGDLFTALSSGDIENRKVNLPFMDMAQDKFLYVPGKFRLIGTINTYDKDFIQDFSVALSRRFRFFPVDIPPKNKIDEEFELLWNKAQQIVEHRLSEWGATASVISDLRHSLEDVNGVNYWAALKDLFDYIRWNSEVGVPVGSSQVIDIFSGLITQLVAFDQIGLVNSPVDDAEKTEAQKSVLEALDQSIAESLVKQLDSMQGIENIIRRLSSTPLNFSQSGPTIIELNKLVKDYESI